MLMSIHISYNFCDFLKSFPQSEMHNMLDTSILTFGAKCASMKVYLFKNKNHKRVWKKYSINNLAEP